MGCASSREASMKTILKLEKEIQRKEYEIKTLRRELEEISKLAIISIKSPVSKGKQKLANEEIVINNLSEYLTDLDRIVRILRKRKMLMKDDFKKIQEPHCF